MSLRTICFFATPLSVSSLPLELRTRRGAPGAVHRIDCFGALPGHDTMIGTVTTILDLLKVSGVSALTRSMSPYF